MIYGVAAALLWGLGDLLAKGVVDRVGPRAALLHVQAVGLGIALLCVWGTGTDLALPSRDESGYLILTVTANAVSVALLYLALGRGPAMLAVPLSTCSGAIALAMSIAAGTAEASTHAIILLMGITAAAMAVATRSREGGRCWRTALLALGSAIAGGVATWSAGRWIGPPSTAAFGAILNMGLLTTVALCMVGRGASSHPIPFALVTGAAAVNVGGYAAFLAGIVHGRLDETGVLSTLSGAVAACGAAMLLREHLSPLQTYGLAATVVLVPLLAATT